MLVIVESAFRAPIALLDEDIAFPWLKARIQIVMVDCGFSILKVIIIMVRSCAITHESYHIFHYPNQVFSDYDCIVCMCM